MTTRKKLNFSNKAQAETQVFIYIMVLIIGSGILIFGYKAVTGIKKSADDLLYTKFENTFTHDVKSVSYQGVMSKKYELPTNVEQVCFRSPQATAAPGYAIIDQAIKDGIKDSVFIYPTDRSFFPGVSLDVDPNAFSQTETQFKCIEVNSGILSIRMTGQGSSVLIEE